MAVNSVAFLRHQADVASQMPSAAPVLQPQRVSNLPHSGSAATHDRVAETQGDERGLIELPLMGVAREELQRLGEMLSDRALRESELATLITGNFGRTPMGKAMARQLAADAFDACLPGALPEERQVWIAVVEDAVTMPVESWHERHASPSPALVRPGTPRTLTALYELLHKSSPGVTSWKEVFPHRGTVTTRVAALERVSRSATLDTSVPARNGEGKSWIAVALGAVVFAAGIPTARAESDVSNHDGADARIPLLRQQLANVATPVVNCLVPLGSFITRYPRAVAATVAGSIVTGVITVLHDQFGRSGNGAANSEKTVPMAPLAGMVAPAILANVTKEVRRADPLLGADERAWRAVQALGPAADDVRRLWQLERHGRSDRLPFVDTGPDIEFGGWLIKQVFGEPVPPGGVDMTWSAWTLPNGLRVILTPGKDDRASVQLRFGDGSGIERNGQRGAVHFAEHLWFRRNLAGAQSFDDLYMAAGVKDNAYTTHDTTVYFTEGPVEALPLILFEKSYRLAHATDLLPFAHFKTERNIVLNEVELRDTTVARAHGVLARAMYPLGHPYRTSVGGRPKDLNSLEVGDMENFMRARQRPNLATLVISGDVDEEEIRGLVTGYFACIEPGNAFPQRTPKVQQRLEDTSDEIFDSVPTPRLYRAWNVPQDGHADLPALTLCAKVLTDRLNNALKNDIVFGAAYVEPRELGSQFHILLSLRDDVDQAWVGEMLDGVSAALLAEGPTEGELEGARRALISGSAWTRATSEGIASAVVHCVDKSGDPDCLNVEVQAWHDATPARVKEVAGQWLARGSHTLLVTPGDRPRPLSKWLDPVPDVSWDAGVPNAGLRAVATNVDRTVPPPVPPPGPVECPAVLRTELSNGVPLVFAPVSKVEKARVVFSFDGGRTGDLDADLGLGVTKAALRVVTQRAASLEQAALSKKLDDLELTVTAKSKPGYSTITLDGPRASLDEGVRVVADMLADTRFPADLLKQACDSARDSMQAIANDPGWRSQVLMRQLVLGEQHPYAVDPQGEGTEASRAAITPEKLQLWARRYLHPSNATIVAVGSFDSDELSDSLAQAFGTMDGGRERSRADIPVPTQSAHAGVHVFPIGEGQQSHVMLGYPVPSNGSTSDILRECIDRIIQRRVRSNLREKEGLAYQVHSLTTATRDVRMGGFTMAVNDASGFDALAAARTVISELLDGRQPVTQEELDLHLFYLRRDLAARFQSPAEVESVLLSAEDLGRHDASIDDAAQAMESLTADEVNRAVRRMVETHLTWILAGPSARGVDQSVSSETDEQESEDAERRLRFTAMGLSQFTEIDPETGARTVHQL